MSDGPKLLLVDGQNLCFREFWSKKNLSYKGKDVDVLFGVFKSLVSYHKKWPDHFRIIAWDAGYERRLRESEEAKARGLIPESYKENRRRKKEEDPNPEELAGLFEQMAELEEVLGLTRTLQVRVKGYEADDIINTYAKYCVRNGGDAVIVSSDQDFYQCLEDGVSVWDAREQEWWTRRRFEEEFGYHPKLWVDKGAIEGEVGQSKDNIFGVPGWGPVNSNKYVREYGSIENIREALQAKEKMGKRERDFLDNAEVLKLAYSLKTMDDIPGIPRPRLLRASDEEAFKNFCRRNGFMSLMKDTWRIA